MFSTGVELRKNKKCDYSKLPENDVFRKALEDDSDEETTMKKKGKLNYVALMNNHKQVTVA